MPQTLTNLAVCGRFHVHNYIRYLLAAGAINKYYYSHKRDNSPDQGAECINVWAKEYLVQAHARLLKGLGAEALYHLSGRVWSRGVLRCWDPAPVLHIVALGVGLNVVRRARDDRAKVIAEAVNTHPAHRRDLLLAETETWGCGNRSVRLLPREEGIILETAQADVLLVPTATVAASYVTKGATAAIVKIPYAANLARFFPDSSPKGRQGGEPLRVLSVGRIGLRKGQLYLLEAVKRLGKDRIALTLVGAIDPTVERVLARYSGLFSYLERIPNAAMRDFMSGFDAYIQPSLEEGLAVSVCEALATGLAVVATRESGADEIFEDGVHGLLIQAADASSIEAALLNLFLNPELGVVLGRAAASHMVARHNWESYAKSLLSLYRSLSGGAGYQLATQ